MYGLPEKLFLIFSIKIAEINKNDEVYFSHLKIFSWSIMSYTSRIVDQIIPK